MLSFLKKSNRNESSDVNDNNNSNPTNLKEETKEEKEEASTNQLIPTFDDEKSISCTSILKGNLDLSMDDKDHNNLNDNANDSDNHSFNIGSGYDQSKNGFDLHLPDLDQLLVRNDTNDSTNDNDNNDDDGHEDRLLGYGAGSGSGYVSGYSMSAISIGTPSVKSQYYHSTTSEAVYSVANETEYVSLTFNFLLLICFGLIWFGLVSLHFYEFEIKFMNE